MIRKYLVCRSLPLAHAAASRSTTSCGASRRRRKLEPPVTPARSPFGKTVAGAGLVEAQTENIAVGSPPAGRRRGGVRQGRPEGRRPATPLFRLDDRAPAGRAGGPQGRPGGRRRRSWHKLEQMPRAGGAAGRARPRSREAAGQPGRPGGPGSSAPAGCYAQRAIGEEELIRREQALPRWPASSSRQAEADLRPAQGRRLGAGQGRRRGRRRAGAGPGRSRPRPSWTGWWCGPRSTARCCRSTSGPASSSARRRARR